MEQKKKDTKHERKDMKHQTSVSDWRTEPSKWKEYIIEEGKKQISPSQKNEDQIFRMKCVPQKLSRRNEKRYVYRYIGVKFHWG